MTAWMLIAMLFGSNSKRDVETHVDAIELNHVFDKYGKCRLSQVILWYRNPSDGKMDVRSWHYAKDDFDCPYRSGDIVWFKTTACKVHSRIFFETYTHDDREIDNKSRLENDRRYALPMRILEKIDESAPPANLYSNGDPWRNFTAEESNAMLESCEGK